MVERRPEEPDTAVRFHGLGPWMVWGAANPPACRADGQRPSKVRVLHHPPEFMTVDDYIEQRNALYLKAENAESRTIGSGKSPGPFANLIWTELGVANRHIERVIEDKVKLFQVEKEIQDCFKRVRDLPAWRNWQTHLT